MSSNKLFQYPLKVKVLSPLYIGDNDTRELSPYADYILDQNGDHALYLNEKSVIAAVQERGRLEEYLRNLRTAFDNNRSNFNLRSFLLGELGLSVTDITKHQISNYGLTADNRLPISPTVKTMGKAYLPGSSLKGALRTAMLYHWLTSSAGKAELSQAFRIIKRLEKQLPEKRALSQRARRGDRRAKQRQREMGRAENRELRDMLSEERLFGKITESDGQNIRVTDSELLPATALAIYPAKRVRLRPVRGYGKKGSTADSDIPQYREALVPGTFIHTQLSILDRFRNQELRYLVGQSKDWIHALNRFAEECIDNELWQLQVAQGYHGIYAARAKALTKFYEELKGRLDNGNLFLRLGAGKTVYDNSLLLALIYGDPQQREEETYFRMIREVLFDVPEDVDLFPMTRTVAGDGTPMGWVEIEVEDKNMPSLQHKMIGNLPLRET